MPMVIVLRVLSVMAVTVGLMLVGIALVDANKSAIDIFARALIWTIVAFVTWSQSKLHEKIMGDGQS